jgi:hypothetical protein
MPEAIFSRLEPVLEALAEVPLRVDNRESEVASRKSKALSNIESRISHAE